MLGNLSVSPLFPLKSATCRSVAPLDFLSSTPEFALLKLNPQNHVNRGCPAHLVSTSLEWKLCSIARPQSLIVLEDDDKNMWEASRQALSAFKFSVEEVDTILNKAFGWVHSPYWGEEQTKRVPNSESINEKIDYLRNLGLSDDDLCKLLKKFPEVLGCSFADELKSNVGTLEREWGIKGKALRNLLLRNPKVLGYNVDCKGDCMAKCTRCWVRF